MLHMGHILAALMPYDSSGLEPALSSVVVDSRKVKNGSLFVAFRGEKVDGHNFVANAFAAGATATTPSSTPETLYDLSISPNPFASLLRAV